MPVEVYSGTDSSLQVPVAKAPQPLMIMRHTTVADGQTAGLNQTARLSYNFARCNILVDEVPANWASTLPEKFSHYQCPEPETADAVVKVRRVNSDSLIPGSVPHDLNDSSRLQFGSNTITFVSDWCEATFKLKPLIEVELLVHQSAKSWFAGILENTLRVLMAYLAHFRGGVLLHSAAVFKGSSGVVLFGHSGAGKSTTSEIALESGYSVVSDDINVLLPQAGQWQIHAVPFSGTFNAPYRSANPIALTGVYRLKQSGQNRVTRCSIARGVALLSGSAAFLNNDPHRSEALIDILSDLANSADASELMFTRSADFLRLIFNE